MPCMMSANSGLDRWAHRHARRRGTQLWQVVNGLNDTVAVIYTNEQDARVMASSRDLLKACGDLLAILRTLAEWRLTTDEAARIRNAAELVRRTCLDH